MGSVEFEIGVVRPGRETHRPEHESAPFWRQNQGLYASKQYVNDVIHALIRSFSRYISFQTFAQPAFATVPSPSLTVISWSPETDFRTY